MEENKKNQTTVLEGNSLEAFFTEAPKETETLEDKNDLFNRVEPSKQIQTEEEEEEIKQNIPPQTPPIQNQPNSYYYDNVVKDYIESGDWDDMVVETEVDGETVEKPLSEIENIDKDTFHQIRSEIKKLKDEEFNEKYISVEGLDETTKKMVELKRKGGDISSLIQAEVKHVHPLKGLDLDDEKVHEGLLRQKLTYQGIDEDVIHQTIAKYKKDLVLDKKASEIIEEINTNFDGYVEAESQRQLKEIEATKEKQKEFRKTMSETIKGLDIKEEKIVKSLLDSATKIDSEGLSQVDKAFFEAKQNPNLFAKITFLLTDEELYDKHMGVKIKNKANLDTVKKVLSLKKRSTSEKPKTIKKEKGLDAFFEQQS